MIENLKTFLFPARCLHCDRSIDVAVRVLCNGCATVLPWLEIPFRCQRCFLEICSCSSLSGALYSRIAAFAHIGPAAALLHQLKFAGREEIAEVFASSLLIQMEKAQMPWPDLLIPVPHARWHAFFNGYRSAELIAKSLGKRMRRPVVKALGRSFKSLPQRCKKSEEREKLSKEAYFRRGRVEILDKTVLLVDDVSTTSRTLSRCAEALKSGFPLKILAASATLVD